MEQGVYDVAESNCHHMAQHLHTHCTGRIMPLPNRGLVRVAGLLKRVGIDAAGSRSRGDGQEEGSSVVASLSPASKSSQSSQSLSQSKCVGCFAPTPPSRWDPDGPTCGICGVDLWFLQYEEAPLP